MVSLITYTVVAIGNVWLLYASSTAKFYICLVLHLNRQLSFFLPFSLSFSVCISSVCSSKQFRDTQCCWTGQCHRRACEEQDGEIDIISKTNKYMQVCGTFLMDLHTSIYTLFFWCCWQRMASWPTSHLSGLWLTMPAVHCSNKWALHSGQYPKHTFPLAYVQYSTDTYQSKDITVSSGVIQLYVK